MVCMNGWRILFCRYSEHSVDYVPVDTIKDHLQSTALEKKQKLAKLGVYGRQCSW